MCEFVSWIEKGDKVYFLTGEQVFNTRKGEALQKWCGSPDDYIGHGAIRHYYGLEQDEGTNKECTNFSTPKNFPSVISEAIKNGKMRGLAIELQLLTKPAFAEYAKVKQQAYAEYKKVEQQAYAEYKKVKQQAFAEYKKVEQQAFAEYKKVEQPAFWDIFSDPKNRKRGWR